MCAEHDSQFDVFIITLMCKYQFWSRELIVNKMFVSGLVFADLMEDPIKSAGKL